MKLFRIFTFYFLLFLPFLAAAQFGSVQEGRGVVPVPQFFVFGPAGEFSATGLILSLISIALAIAGFVAVLFLIVGGFRYITAHGNEELVEGAKKTITHAIIGIVVIILSFVVIRVIANALIFGRLGT